ncbi:MAG TPA: hypothetical protein VJ548_06725 [Azospira sp.]|nr:hypothetical protein [Azospira sp.]
MFERIVVQLHLSGCGIDAFLDERAKNRRQRQKHHSRSLSNIVLLTAKLAPGPLAAQQFFLQHPSPLSSFDLQ